MDLDKQLALNKKLARWAGFTWFDEPCPSDCCGGHCGWRYPNGDTVYPLGMMGLPDFTKSLDLCFEWLVPHIRFAIITFDTTATDEIYVVTLTDFYLAQPSKEYREEAETPALALCKAIEKLVDNES